MMDAIRTMYVHGAELAPDEIRHQLRAFIGAKALLSGIELGVFDALADEGPLPLPVLARRLVLPPPSLQRLLTYLCARGWLEQRGAGYANASTTETYLVSDRPTYLGGDAWLLGHDLYARFHVLCDAIREDSNRWPQAVPGRDQEAYVALYRDPQALRGYLSGMAAVTRPVAVELCAVFDFGAARCLLDIGGASAVLATTVLQAHPHLRGISLDLPDVAPLARELVAHAGLRAQECTTLHWADVHLARRDLVVRHGKGGKQRVVALSATLRQALQAVERHADGYVLPYRTPGSAWRHMQALCRAAGVTPKGVHALRHAAGTRLYAQTHDLEATARHLGHAKLETTRIYAKWSDRQLRETIGRW